jgi:xanthine dehydrogenase accessory factor
VIPGITDLLDEAVAGRGGERAEVLDVLRRLRADRFALATVVAVLGSSYRGPGARLVVAADGRRAGGVSAGCLEHDVAAQALAVMARGEPEVVRFDTSSGDESTFGWGLGCSGVIEVLVEPGGAAEIVERALAAVVDHRRAVTLTTVVGSTISGIVPGGHLLLDAGGPPAGFGNPAVESLLAEDAREKDGRTALTTLRGTEGQVRVLVERLEPAPRLVICGAGPDVPPVAAAGAALGWEVIVVEDRSARLDCIPGAAIRHVRDPRDAAGDVGVDPWTAVVIMSHHYLRDRAYLEGFLRTDPGYLGCLGPRARFERLVSDLRSAGTTIEPRLRDRLRGPAGLDLGGEEPAEIALSIVAEAMAVIRRREGGPLRLRPGPIHPRGSGDR